MFKRAIKTVTDKVLTASNAAKAMSGNISKDDAISFVRTEVTDLVRATVFRYAIWMNLVFGFVGFVIGCIVMAVVL